MRCSNLIDGHDAAQNVGGQRKIITLQTVEVVLDGALYGLDVIELGQVLTEVGEHVP